MSWVQLRVGWQLLRTKRGAPTRRRTTREPPMGHAVPATATPRDGAVTHARQRVSTSARSPSSPITPRTLRRLKAKGLRPEACTGLADPGATAHGFPGAAGGTRPTRPRGVGGGHGRGVPAVGGHLASAPRAGRTRRSPSVKSRPRLFELPPGKLRVAGK